MFEGTAHVFGRDVDTDVIIPARYLNTSDPAEPGTHCLEEIDPEFRPPSSYSSGQAQLKLNSSTADGFIKIIFNKKAANLFRLSGPALVALTILIRFNKYSTRQLVRRLHIQCICSCSKCRYIKVPVVGALCCISCPCSYNYTVVVYNFNYYLFIMC